MVIRWRLAEAQKEFAALSSFAERHGYRLTLLGSVILKGEGDDLDLFCVPIRDKCQAEWGLICAFGGHIVKRHTNQSKGVQSYEVERQGRVYHWIFGTFWSERGEG